MLPFLAVPGGAEIADDFIDPLREHFLEALPIVIGFLVLLAAVAFLILFLVDRFRTRMKALQ